MKHTTRIERMASDLYWTYCEAVGGVAYNGDPLPCWVDFIADPKKQKQADGWRAVADLVVRMLASQK